MRLVVKNNNNNIVVKRKISAQIAFSSWLILVVLPMFLMCISLRQVLNITKEVNTVQCKRLLIDEMSQFKKDFTLDAFVSRTCKRLIKTNRELFCSGKTQIIINKFKRMGLSPSILIRHSKDTQKLQYYYAKNLQDSNFKLSAFFIFASLAPIINDPA